MSIHNSFAGIMSKAPFILLVNPWIRDFAAFDLWAKPMGLLMLGSLLRQGGCGVAFVDCLSRHDPATENAPDVLPGRERPHGTGKYHRMRVPKPEVFSGFPRTYYRYGIHPDSLRSQLTALPVPDLIWVTSAMTYWYEGVKETIAVLREVFPAVPVWLGGIYAALCPAHARKAIGADEIVTCPQGDLPDRVRAATGFTLSNRVAWRHFRTSPPPALDLLSRPAYAPLLTSRGCPFRCPYCASGVLYPDWERRDASAIHGEIVAWHRRYGVLDFAFYDDALLLHAQSSLKPALEQLAGEGLALRFHTPNALHIRALTPDWCRLLHAAGFKTIRLGLETLAEDEHRRWGGKVLTGMFETAMKNLFDAGFTPEQIGVYLLCGVPGQSRHEVARAIRAVARTGARPRLAEYSPVPRTPMWEDARRIAPFDIEGEPLFHNNSFFACRRPDFTYEHMKELKLMAGDHDREGRGGGLRPSRVEANG